VAGLDVLVNKRRHHPRCLLLALKTADWKAGDRSQSPGVFSLHPGLRAAHAQGRRARIININLVVGLTERRPDELQRRKAGVVGFHPQHGRPNSPARHHL